MFEMLKLSNTLDKSQSHGFNDRDKIQIITQYCSGILCLVFFVQNILFDMKYVG